VNTYPIGNHLELYESAEIRGIWPQIVKDSRTREYLAVYMLGVYSHNRKESVPLYGLYTTEPNEKIIIELNEETVKVSYVSVILPTIKKKFGEVAKMVRPEPIKTTYISEEILKPGEYVEFLMPYLYILSQVELTTDGPVTLVDNFNSKVAIRMHAKVIEEFEKDINLLYL